MSDRKNTHEKIQVWICDKGSDNSCGMPCYRFSFHGMRATAGCNHNEKDSNHLYYPSWQKTDKYQISKKEEKPQLNENGLYEWQQEFVEDFETNLKGKKIMKNQTPNCAICQSLTQEELHETFATLAYKDICKAQGFKRTQDCYGSDMCQKLFQPTSEISNIVDKIDEIDENEKHADGEKFLSKEAGLDYKTQTYDYEEMLTAYEAGKIPAAKQEALKYKPLISYLESSLLSIRQCGLNNTASIIQSKINEINKP